MNCLFKKLPITPSLRLLRWSCILFVFWSISTPSIGEGTKEIRPNAGDNGYLVLDAAWSNFAFYGCPETNRLQITVCRPNEKIYFGFNQSDRDVEFRIKNAAGAIVFNSQLVPNTGTGFIRTHAEALAGPRQLVGATGYDALVYNAAVAGDYYIEFKRPNARREFEYFDITVASAANIIQKGRVWSKAWMFSTRSFNARFEGKLFIYADDGIVTSLDFNGMQPYVFVVSANQSGTANTGNPRADRQSTRGNKTYPQYKIFLNDPDNTCYPTGAFGNVTKQPTLTGCGLDRCINISVDKPGNIDLVLDLNGTPGYQPNTEDLIISAAVVIGDNCIKWNSRDGKGNVLPSGLDVPIEVNYFNGLTHLPLFDVEGHTNGFIVELVRPVSGAATLKPHLFWDDSQITNPNPEKVNLSGCTLAGCHKWFWAGADNPATDFGNTNTVNTWWYANIIKKNAEFELIDVVVDANTKKLPSQGNDTTFCATSPFIPLFGGIAGPSNLGGSWTGGAGTFDPGRNVLNPKYIPTPAERAAGRVTLVLGSNPIQECPAEYDTLKIKLTPAPMVDAGTDQSFCGNINSIQLGGTVAIAKGGKWTGGKGLFTPDSTALNAIYAPSAAEKSAGSVTLTLVSTGNGLCSPVSDPKLISFSGSPTATAGNDTSICSINPSIKLGGKVTIATGGKWAGGTGNYTPNANVLDATYTPSASEINAGFVVLTLETTGNSTCNASKDEIRISFSAGPQINAGSDMLQCANNKISLSGSGTGITGGIWTGSSGTFSPNANLLVTEYSPSPSEITAGKVTLILTSTGGCSVVKDSVTINFTGPPSISAGANKSSCANNPQVSLAGTFNGATGMVWKNGNGTWIPNNQTSNATYTPSSDEILIGIVALISESTGNGGCSPVKDTMLIIINPAPTANAGSDQLVCKNNPVIKLNGRNTNSPSVKGWSGGSGIFSSINTDTATYSPTEQEIIAGTVTLSYTVNKSGCLPVADRLNITFTPTPIAEAGPSQVICINNPFVKLNGSITGASGGRWVGNGSFVPGPNDLTATYNATAQEVASGGFQLKLISEGNNNCNAVQDSVSFTFSPAPAINAGSDQTVCSNNPVTKLNGGNLDVATGGTWSGGSGIYAANINDLKATYTPTPTEVSAGSIVLTLSTTGNGNCMPVSDQVKISFSPSPTVTVNTPITVCADAPTLKLNGATTIATGGIWTGGNGTYVPNPTTLNATYTPSLDEIVAGSANLVLTSTGNENCNAVSTIQQIQVVKAPTVSAGADQVVCGNNSGILLSGSVQMAAGARWSSSGTGRFAPNENNLDATYIPSQADKTSGSVTLQLTTTGNGLCKAVDDNMVISFTNIPQVTAGSNVTVCSNDIPVRLNGSGSPATWLGGQGTFAPDRNNFNASYTPSTGEIANGSFTLVLATQGTIACPRVTDTVQIKLQTGPQVNAGSLKTVCGSLGSVQLDATINTPFKGIWIPSGTGTLLPNANDLKATYQFSAADKNIGFVNFELISIHNGVCRADTSNVKITITPLVVADAGPDLKYCGDVNEIPLNGIIKEASGALWSTNGTGIFLPSATTLNARYKPSSADTSAGRVTLTITTDANTVCPSVSDSKVIILTPTPKVSADPDITICGDSSYVFLQGRVAIATNGKWSTSGTGNFSPNVYALNARYFPSQADKIAGNVNITLTSEGNGTCNAVTDQMVLTITAPPTANAGNNSTVCADLPTVSLNGSVTISAGGQWTTTGTGSFGSQNSLNTIYNPSQADISSGIVTLTLQSTGNSQCKAVSSKMIVRIIPPPTVNAGLDQVVCADASGISLNGRLTGATRARWKSSGTGTFLPNDSALAGIYKPSPADTSARAVRLTLTILSAGQCTPRTDELDIIINPAPWVRAGNDITVCEDTVGIKLTGMVTNARGNIWRTNGSGAFFPSAAVINPQYVPSQEDKGKGSVMLTLESSNHGNCMMQKDDLVLSLSPSPRVYAGTDTILCSDANAIILKGTKTIASGIVWSSTGNGQFLPNNTSENATYSPSAGDKGVGSATLTLITTGNGLCKAVSDKKLITISTAPKANAGLDKSICADQNKISLAGTIKMASGGTWTTNGTGIFTPTGNQLITDYNMSTQDKETGFVTFILRSTGNTICNAALDTVRVSLIPLPTSNAGADQSICASAPSVNLSGNVLNASAGIWETTGSGTFSPNSAVMNAVYLLTPADKLSSTLTFKLKTTGSGQCTHAVDEMQVIIIPEPLANAGPDMAICADREFVDLSATVINSSQVNWISSGNGTFSTSKGSVNTTYIPSASDRQSGKVVFTISASGGTSCQSVSDQALLTITPAPSIEAGPNQTVCPDVTSIEIDPTIKIATGAVWFSSGDGTFDPGADNIHLKYIPAPSDILAGSVKFGIASTGNGLCNAVYDSIRIYFTGVPKINAGPDRQVCDTDLPIRLDGSGTSGIWSGYSGTFSPNDQTLNAVYSPSLGEVAGGSLKLYISSSSTGTCAPSVDTVLFTIVPGPVIAAGGDQTVCSNTAAISLNGNVGTAAGGVWNTSGTGRFNTASDLTTTYVPSAEDISGGNVLLSLTNTPYLGCSNKTDTLIIEIVPAPEAMAGADQAICAEIASIQIQGNSKNSSSVIWSALPTGGSFDNNLQVATRFSPSASDIATGAVKLVLKAIGNNVCSVATDTMLVTIKPRVTLNAGPDITLCADAEAITLGATFSNAGGVNWSTSGSGIFAPNNTTASARYIPAGSDTTGNVILQITTTNNGMCSPAVDDLVVAFTPAPSITVGANQTLCAETMTAALTSAVKVSGGVQWSTSGNGSFVANNLQLNPTYVIGSQEKENGGAIITVESTNNGTCKPVRAYLNLTILPTPGALVNAGNDQMVCATNKSIQLNGNVKDADGGSWSTNGTGRFSPGITTLNATYIPSPQDTANKQVSIVLTTTNSAGCDPVSDTMKIYFEAPPTSSAGLPMTVCADTAGIVLRGLQANANGATWTSTGTGIFSVSNVVLTPTYTLSQSDKLEDKIGFTLVSNGSGVCLPVTSSVVLNIGKEPTVYAGIDQSTCAGSSGVILQGSKTIARGSMWSSSGTGQFVPDEFTLTSQYIPSQADKDAGIVLIQIRSTGNGLCKPAADTAEVIIVPSPRVNAGFDQTICADATGVKLKGNVEIASSGKWSTSGSGRFTPNDTALDALYVPSIEDIRNGVVTITLQSAESNNCDAISDDMLVSILPQPTSSAGAVKICDIKDGAQLNGALTFADGGYWTSAGSGIFAPDANTLDAKYYPSGEDIAKGSVMLSLSSVGRATCASVISTALLQILPAPAALAGPDMIVCRGSEVNLMTTAASGVGYFWKNLQGDSISSTQPARLVIKSDSTFILSAIDARGCISTDTMKVGVIDPPTFDMNDHFCFNDTLMVDSRPVNLPLVNGLFQWDKNDKIMQGEDRSVIFPHSSGKYTIIYAYKGCTVNDSTLVTEPPKVAAISKLGCADDVVTLNTAKETGVTYLWRLNSQVIGNTNEIKTKVLIDTTYYQVQAIEAKYQCASSGMVRVVGLPKPILSLTDVTGCDKEKGFLNARPSNILRVDSLATTYVWKHNGVVINVNNDTLQVSKTGRYSVMVTVEVCSTLDSAEVLFHPIPGGVPTHTREFCDERDKFVVLDGGTEPATKYLWEPSGAVTHKDTVETEGMHYVTKTNAFNCISRDSIKVFNRCPPRIFVPTAFIPGTTREPFFKVFGKDFTNFKIMVFSRWGEIIYYSEDRNETWDGKYKGEYMPVGVYPYLITYEGTAEGFRGPFKDEGTITLIR